MDPDDEYEYNICDININSFNNKDDKGDDDFESWMMNEAPFSSSGDYTVDISDYTVNTVDTSTISTISMSNASTITFGTPVSNDKIRKLKYSIPIDILYKWFPDKDDDFDDEIPF
jgi:hypothetical protein